MGDRRLALKVAALRISLRDALRTAESEPAYRRALAIEEVATRAFFIAQTLRNEDRGARYEGELGAIEDEVRSVARGIGCPFGS